MNERELVIQYIEEQSECEWVDFKEKFYQLKHDKDSFIKDVVSFANNLNKKDKYIIFGVEDKTRSVCGISRENIIDVSNFEKLLYEKVEPKITISLDTFYYNEKLIGFIKIPTSNDNLPYVIKSECGKVKQGDIYIRRGSVNVNATRRDLDDIYLNRHEQKIIPYENYIIIEPIHMKNSLTESPTYGILDIEIMNLANQPLLINSGLIEISNVFGKIERSIWSILPNINIQENPFEIAPNSRFTKKTLFDFLSSDCITLHFDDDGHLPIKTYVKTTFEDINGKVFESEPKEFFITAKGDILHKIKRLYKEFRLYLKRERKDILRAIEMNQDNLLKQFLDVTCIDFSLVLPDYVLNNAEFPEYDICVEMIRRAKDAKNDYAIELMRLKGLSEDFIEFSIS